MRTLTGVALVFFGAGVACGQIGRSGFHQCTPDTKNSEGPSVPWWRWSDHWILHEASHETSHEVSHEATPWVPVSDCESAWPSASSAFNNNKIYYHS